MGGEGAVQYASLHMNHGCLVGSRMGRGGVEWQRHWSWERQGNGSRRNGAYACAGAVAMLLSSGDAERREKCANAPARALKLVRALCRGYWVRGRSQRHPTAALWAPRGRGWRGRHKLAPGWALQLMKSDGGGIAFERARRRETAPARTPIPVAALMGRGGELEGVQMCACVSYAARNELGRVLWVRRGVDCVERSLPCPRGAFHSGVVVAWKSPCTSVPAQTRLAAPRGGVDQRSAELCVAHLGTSA